jgi:hypothetical protein
VGVEKTLFSVFQQPKTKRGRLWFEFGREKNARMV